jgi:ribonuclease VapC
MIVDSSALLAVILNELDEPAFATAMVDAPSLHISAANWVEAAIVVDRHDDRDAASRFDALIAALRIEIQPVTPDIATLARQAHRRFGRGQHRAGLNYGDCFSYALARHRGEKLLCKGNDFIHTDIELVIDPRNG